MSRNLRLEINGRNVRNPFLRTVLGVVVLVLVAALLLILGVIFLPLFLGLLVIASVAGGIWIYRVRRFLRDARQASRDGSAPEGLDPSMEVRVPRSSSASDRQIDSSENDQPIP